MIQDLTTWSPKAPKISRPTPTPEPDTLTGDDEAPALSVPADTGAPRGTDPLGDTSTPGPRREPGDYQPWN